MENKAKKESSHVHHSLHEDSHTICKTKYKPKIRIIHIYAPEIIKTDVENFRELVQKLTGKPTSEDQSTRKKKKKQPSTKTRKNNITSRKEKETSGNDNGVLENNPTKKMELRNDDSDEKVKEEEVGSFRDGGGFSDLEGFISELFPLDATHHMQGFVEKLYA
ncbi:hypothetical protein HN51_054212 [Arachis hypogaea]|uniref:VQ motif-containing protein n=1 Tax=Arachis hypogaea TaxID=3818 RepID=A0A444XG16_ARAHY|nr:VQ motif-containing protein 25-like [Arachis ipaensis]XP_025678154.1 VQ motif-containing protein 25-like [Arachis hypogaea]QHN76722.1 VQ motif-containing protein [Arachis hypogaea]RYQ88675.1 hypothetical protein Ahy_B09g095731 [Arachis hypogaea]